MPVETYLRVQGVNELVAGLDVLPAVMAVENEKAMVIAADLAEADIKRLTPRKTGRLFSAWDAHTTGFGFATVGIVDNSVEYAGFVEEGSGPHDIVAHGNALMIPVASGGGFGGGTLSGRARANQQVAFFTRVHHPGAPGRYMAKKGLAAATPAIFLEFRKAADQAIRLSLRAIGSLYAANKKLL